MGREILRALDDYKNASKVSMGLSISIHAA
jgi:hypothetical protein